MLIFTLAISCSIMSNLPWFVNLIFQVPLQYCSFQLWTTLLPPDISTTECNFHFGPATSFFLELLVNCPPLFPSSILDTFQPGRGSSFGVICLSLFILFMGFSRQEYWSGLPFPPPVDHIVSELCTLTCPSWVACTVWLIAPLSYSSPCTTKKLCSVKGIFWIWILYYRFCRSYFVEYVLIICGFSLFIFLIVSFKDWKF